MCHAHLSSSAEQYTGYVVIPQYCFLIPSNFMNTVIPQSTDIYKIFFFNDVFQFILCKNKTCVLKGTFKLVILILITAATKSK